MKVSVLLAKTFFKIALSLVTLSLMLLASTLNAAYHAMARDSHECVKGARSYAATLVMDPVGSGGIATQVGLYFTDSRRGVAWFLIGFIRSSANNQLELYSEYQFLGGTAQWGFRIPASFLTYYTIETIISVSQGGNYVIFRVNGQTRYVVSLPEPSYVALPYIAIVHAESDHEDNELLVDYKLLRYSPYPEGPGSQPSWSPWKDPFILYEQDNMEVNILSDTHIMIAQNR